MCAADRGPAVRRPGSDDIREVDTDHGRRPYRDAGPAYGPGAGGYFGGGILPGLLVGTMLGSMMAGPAYEEPGQRHRACETSGGHEADAGRRLRSR